MPVYRDVLGGTMNLASPEGSACGARLDRFTNSSDASVMSVQCLDPPTFKTPNWGRYTAISTFKSPRQC